MALSPSQRVADLILQNRHGETLSEFLRRLRHHPDRPRSYDAIGRELYLATGGEVSISYQTVKRWLIELDVLEERAS